MKKHYLVTLFIVIYLAVIIPFMLHYYNLSIFWRDTYYLTGNPSQYELYNRYMWNMILVFCISTLLYQSIILVFISFIKQYRGRHYLLGSFFVAILLSLLMIYASYRISLLSIVPIVSISFSAFFSLIQYRYFKKNII